MKLPILITTLNNRPEQVEGATKCFNSLVSQEHLLDIGIDNGNESISLTQKWNRFIEQWLFKDYQYLIVTANDTYARPESIDHFVRFMEDNPKVGIGESALNRGSDFADIPIEYTKEYEEVLSDTSNFIIRKGVIEEIGLFDEGFPFAQNERDYIHRCKLKDIKVVQTRMKLFYHPVNSMTMENRGDYQASVERYKQKWGGEWLNEKYTQAWHG